MSYVGEGGQLWSRPECAWSASGCARSVVQADEGLGTVPRAGSQPSV